MKTQQIQSLLVTALVCALASTATNTRAAEPAPRLVLQITVDQLRGDLPGRYAKHMGQGGWRYLMDHGIWYADAHHAHANTETIVGHTTLATGADPAVHGMIGNVWLDRLTGSLTYNIEDPKYHTLTPGSGVNKATEIDPTQKIAKSDGRSPAAILGSTFSDELAIHTGGRAKIFGVSVKDRGAVSMAGHAGKAFWFSKASGEFVTSSNYYDRYPAWVDAFNKQKLPAAYADKSWELMHEKSTYLFGDADDKPWETAMPGYGRIFPHAYGPVTGTYFTTFLTLSPAGDELTLAFAKALMDAEKIGEDEVTDYLSISFSSTDYVGHIFSPSSLEAEDNQLRLDRTLADLFAYVDKRIGLKNVVIVLSADHGGPEAPGYLNALGIEAKYIATEKWDKSPTISSLKEKFGIGQELIQSFRQPYVYLNREVIREKGLDAAVVEKAVVKELVKFEGVSMAISSTALNEGKVPNTPLIQSVLRNFNPRRSGDIFLVFEPHCFINDFDGLIVACTHGAPWRYDTFVPVVFAGGNLTGQRVYRPIETVDVAPTLSAIVGAKPPSGSRTGPLLEVMRGSVK
ncbi:MAG: alkaline phosphatase family protein [Verrucomicrobiales bacterium]|nr:alkaline phosphatase family protein [Verrucomicrobiales bacterium]